MAAPIQAVVVAKDYETKGPVVLTGVQETVQLPGSATVAALTATITLPDGTSTVENRTVRLGDTRIQTSYRRV